MKAIENLSGLREQFGSRSAIRVRLTSLASRVRAVGLLARAVCDFLRAHGGGHFAHPFNVLAFIRGDLGPQRFGGPFHLLDTDFHARQFVQQRWQSCAELRASGKTIPVSALGPAGRIHGGIGHSRRKPASNAKVPTRFRRSSRDGRDSGPHRRRGKVIPVPHNRWCPR